jgi:phage tail-like protein
VKVDEIAALLPAVFREALASDEIFQTLLEIMEAIQEPIEERMRRLSLVFNVLLTEEAFVLMLARWVDLEWLFMDVASDSLMASDQGWDSATIPFDRLRLLIAQSNVLSAQRGTARGLQRFLEIATGSRGFQIDETTQPFHIVVRVPAAVADQELLIERIIVAEKPAYVTWEKAVLPAPAST